LPPPQPLYRPTKPNPLKEGSHQPFNLQIQINQFPIQNIYKNMTSVVASNLGKDGYSPFICHNVLTKQSLRNKSPTSSPSAAKSNP
jgi:hypothetical protein